MSTLGPRLRHRVTVQERVTSRDSNGNVLHDFVDYDVDIPAEVTFLSARDLIAAQAAKNETIARVVVRRNPDKAVSDTMRLVYDGTNYAITAVLPDPTGSRYVTLMVATGVSNG